MIAPIAAACNASAPVLALFGTPPRVYPFGLVDIDPPRPYAVWQNIGGRAEQYLGDLPDADYFTTQIDVYGTTPAEVMSAARALRDAFELRAYITAWGNQVLDEETKLYRFSFDVSWIVPR